MPADQTSRIEFSGARGSLARVRPLLALRGRAGGKAVATLQVSNRSQVPLALERTGSIQLRRADALSRGVREAFREPGQDLVSRLISLGQNLREEPAIKVRVTYSANFDALQPGESAEVKVSLQIPRDSQPAADWSLRLPILGNTIAASLEIAPAADARPRPTPSGPARGRRSKRKGDSE